MSMQALREHKQELARQANHLLSEKGSQTWAKDDQAKFDNIADEMERIDAQIGAHQKLLDATAEKVAPRKEPGSKSDVANGVELFLRKSFKDMSPEEVLAVRNTMSTTTGSQGGYSVQSPEVMKEFIDYMKDYGGMRRVSDRIVTSGGADIQFPTTDGTAEVGEIVAQNVAATSADPSFGAVTLSTYKFSSKIVTIPIELLQDSVIDVVALVQKRIRDRIGRIQNTKFTVGSGTSEPNGVTTAATVGKTGATGQTLTVIYDDLVDLIDSVDLAYLAEGEMTFMFAQSMRKVIRKIKDTQGRPIWTPNYDAGITGAFADQLLGYPVNINNDMPTPAANAVSISFGQHKKYMVRDAMEVTMFRFDDSAYMSKGQVGFLAWARSGGNLLDTKAVATYKHSAT